MESRSVTLTSSTPVGALPRPGEPAPRVMAARPEPVAFQPASTALVVVDMQNAYASLGGYVDTAGFDISGAQGVIANIVRAIDAVRAGGAHAQWQCQHGVIGQRSAVGRW